MALAITHSTIATLPDQPGVEINKGEWNANHTITGTQPLAYASFSSTNSTAGTEEYIKIPSGTFTLTLTNPTIATGLGWRLYIKNAGSGTVTLSGTIDGGSSWTLTAGSSVTLLFDPDNSVWEVF